MLIDSGRAGRWAADAIAGANLLAPAIVDFEVANIVRRHELSGRIGTDQSAQAHADLLDLTIERWPYESLAERAWRHRHNLSTYDASYVAVAELNGATLLTLDQRIERAPGVRCDVVTPTAT